MRFFSRIRRGPLVTAVVGAIAVAVVAVIALVSPGYTTQDMELDDGSVWVPNGTQQMVGHANTQLAELSSAITANGTDLSLIQDPTRLAIHDRSNNTLDLTDPAKAELTTPVPLPAGNPEVLSTGKTLLTYLPDSGDAWITSLDSVASSLSAKAPATRQLGANVSAAVDTNEHFAAYSAKSHQLLTGSLSAGAKASKTREVTFSGATADVQIALVGGKTVLYNPRTNEAWVDGKTYALGGQITRPDSARLMQSTVDSSRVLIAHDEGLVALSLKGGSPQPLGEHAGNAAAPVHLGDCDYAAWSGGTAIRLCGSADTVEMTLDGARASAEMDLLVNGRNVVANDPASGNTWAVQRAGQLIDNWADFQVDDSDPTTQTEPKDVPPTKDTEQKPPIAKDDAFGVRANQANKLPVLLNDFDANGDPLVITEVSAIPPEFGTLSIVDNGQQILLTTTGQASGGQAFTYTIDDGHGGTDTATVTTTVKDATENTAPYQARSTRTSLTFGGTAVVSVLNDWIDPESDPFYLANAQPVDGGTVRFTPDGTVTYIDSGSGKATKSIEVTVSDGDKEATGVINLYLGAKGKMPIIADSFTMTGFSGKAIKVEPLGNTRGGSGTIALNGVKAAGDDSASLSRDYDNGNFTATFSQAGTHFVEYSVTDGTQTANALVRFEITSPPKERQAPVTTPTTAFLYLQSSETVDVLASDYDPGGGVLSIARVADAPEQRPRVVVEILEHRVLRVTLLDPLTKPLTIHYVASNGALETPGSLTLVNIPEPVKLQPPIARPDKAVVRAGSQVDISVLENDTQPNNKPLVLDKDLEKDVGDGNGLLFASGDKLRYLAPDKPGEYQAIYRVSSLDGQWASAKVTITVRDLDKANNLPPVPKAITARTTTNDKVVIPIPLSGIDPDGDPVKLLGLAPSSNPALGTLTAINQTSVEYTAGPNAGTDTFEYQVEDQYGAAARGTIRVGVTPADQLGTPPIAMPDIVVVRPGTKLSVPVTDNDSDPDGGKIAVVKATSTDGAVEPAISASRIALTAPRDEGTYGVFYTIQNARGGQSSAWLTVQVKNDAPLLSPSADDITLGAAEIDGRTTVQVSPLTTSVHFAESSTAVLKVSLPQAPDGATVNSKGRITLPVGEKSQIIPYTVTRSDDPTVSTSAFIWLPGTEDAAPALRADRKALVVTSGDTLRIKLADQVMAIDKRKVTVADRTTVQATHSDGSDPYVNETTLTFTSATDYWGPASISFTATDGYAKAPITLPITVRPAQEQPPVVKDTHVDLEQAGATKVDLRTITDSPSVTDKNALTFALNNGATSVVNASIDGPRLSIAAVEGASAGSSAKLTITAKDGRSSGTGTVDVTIVSSSKPLVMPVPDKATVQRGNKVSIPVLENDEATNPFPHKPLKLVSLRTTPTPGVEYSMSADRRSVTVKVASSASTGTVSFNYTVADVTGDKLRYTTGVVSVEIQDVPDAPVGAPKLVSKDEPNAAVTLAIPHAFPNNLPVTEYIVEGFDGAEVGRCKNPDACTIGKLTYGQSYQFTAKAVNALGSGKPSPASETIVIDASPAPPGGLVLTQDLSDPNGRTLRGSWNVGSQPSYGTAVAGFEATLSGPDGYNRVQNLDADTMSVQFGDVQPGGQYTLSVKVRNKTNIGEPATVALTAVGPPGAKDVTVTQVGINALLRWTITTDGGANVGVYAAHYPGDAPSGVCDPKKFSANTSGTTWTDTSPRPGYSYGITVSNGVYCRAFPANTLNLRPVAQATASVQTSGSPRNIVVTASANFQDRFEYSLVPNGSGVGGWATLPDNGEIQDAAQYGRASTVYVRACVGNGQGNCSAVVTAGTNLLALRVDATVRGCTAGAQPDVDPPDNGSVASRVQVSYTQTATGAATGWANLGDGGANTPSPAGGGKVTMSTRTIINGTTYPPTDPVTCR